MGRTEGLWVFLACGLDSLLQININSRLSDTFTISLDSSKPASYHENDQQTFLMSPPNDIIIREVQHLLIKALKMNITKYQLLEENVEGISFFLLHFSQI